MVFMPPRHGKSELCSHYLPAWYLGMWPDKKVILTSYEASYAASWGRKCRDTLEEYGAQMFGVSVRQDSRAADSWSIEGHSGEMHTAGCMGPITGQGANLLIIDDPVKNAEEALSQTIRDKTWDWYLSTAMTRLDDQHSAVILIMTRWHQDDLAGRLLDREAGKWEVVDFPALARTDDPLGRKEGHALWPMRFGEEYLAEIRDRPGAAYWWNSMYQQRPTSEDGLLFKRQDFKVVDSVPSGRKVRMWDLAGTKPSGSGDPDWTAGLLMIDADGKKWIDDVIHERLDTYGVEKLILDTAGKDGNNVTIGLFQDPAQAGKFQAEYLAGKLSGYTVEIIKSFPNVLDMARPVISQAKAGNLMMRSANWNTALLDEAVSLPFGRHDDIIAALNGAFKLLTGEDPWSALMNEYGKDDEDSRN